MTETFHPNAGQLIAQPPPYKSDSGVAGMLIFIAIATWIGALIMGIVMGSTFKVAEYDYNLYSGNTDITEKFNIALAVIVWSSGFLQGLVFFALGKLVGMVTAIKDRLDPTPVEPQVTGAGVD